MTGISFRITAAATSNGGVQFCPGEDISRIASNFAPGHLPRACSTSSSLWFEFLLFSAKRCQCGKCFVLNIFMAAISWPECGKYCSYHCHWPGATNWPQAVPMAMRTDRVLTLEVSVSLAKCFRKNAKRSQLKPFTRRLPSNGHICGAIGIGRGGGGAGVGGISGRLIYIWCIGFPDNILVRHLSRFVWPRRFNKFIKLKNAQWKSNQSSALDWP